MKVNRNRGPSVCGRHSSRLLTFTKCPMKSTSGDKMNKTIAAASRLAIWRLVCIIFVLNSIPAYAAKGGKTYYLDSNNGLDSNRGTKQSPWKTLDKINNYELAPGDTVYFARGSRLQGGFVISSSGKPGQPITFTTYGKGPTPVFTNPRYDHLNGNAI